MDEPLSNLDAKLRGHMRAELKHMQHELGITTIYVTHDQIEAMTLAHRVALLEKGVLQQLDTPAQIYNKPANLFVAGFIGSPPMNFLEGDLTDGKFSCRGRQLRNGDARQPSEATIGIRPEDCRIAPPAGKLAGEVFATELIGDHSLVTCRCGGTVTVKVDKDFKRPIGERSASTSPIWLYTCSKGLGRQDCLRRANCMSEESCTGTRLCRRDPTSVGLRQVETPRGPRTLSGCTQRHQDLGQQ